MYTHTHTHTHTLVNLQLINHNQAPCPPKRKSWERPWWDDCVCVCVCVCVVVWVTRLYRRHPSTNQTMMSS